MKGMHLAIDCAAPSAGGHAAGGYATLAPVCIVVAPSGRIMERDRCDMNEFVDMELPVGKAAITAGIRDATFFASAVAGASALKGRSLYRRGQAKRSPRHFSTQFQALKGRQTTFAAA